MELMERVREVGAEAVLDEGRLDAARVTLLREIAREERADAAPGRRLAVRWIGGSALAGGLAAVALVVGFVAIPATAPTASAAEVLERAAEATLTTQAVSPGPGQYIRIQEIATSTVGWVEDSAYPEGGWWGSGASHTMATTVQARSLYVPADRSGDWVQDYDESFEVVEITGPAAETARDVLVATRPGSKLDVEVFPAGIYSQTGVGGEGVDPDDVLTFAVNGLQCYYDEMPRDPEALVDWMEQYEHEYLSDCPPPRLGEPIEFNLAPAGLRAAMFRALALTEGSRVVGVDGDVTTIAFPEGGESTWMQTVDIDTSTGLMVGRGNLDDDSWSSRVVVSIVDGLPATVGVPRG
ncbi:hypothetical protein [Microbacterium sp. CPCC 204701]|uniref:hypothetical protein n=1 Tax=Microbacterium sp. CPCC 204701 TaxID=2493084 RepID=UPI000FDB25C5|nr:hypothetical protein [Microbacterium sp. CPCC 204701]